MSYDIPLNINRKPYMGSPIAHKRFVVVVVVVISSNCSLACYITIKILNVQYEGKSPTSNLSTI